MRIFSAAEYPQGSPSWHELRRGIPTSSDFDRILTPVRCEYSSQADNYARQLISDINNLSPTWFTERGGKPPNQWVEDGIAREAESRKWYAFHTGNQVEEVGFCLSDCGNYGCSPDGTISPDGGLELKNPAPWTHAKYMDDPAKLEKAYRTQVHGQMIVAGFKWVDLVSYCPPTPEHPDLEPVIVRVVPDLFTQALRDALARFLCRLAELKREMGIPEMAYGEIASAH